MTSTDYTVNCAKSSQSDHVAEQRKNLQVLTRPEVLQSGRGRMTDTPPPQESNSKGKAPAESQTNNPGIMDPMKTAVEEVVAATLGNIPGLKISCPPRVQQAQTLPT